jgi:hypothetical protein
MHIRRLEGYSDDSLDYLDTARLITGQRFYQRQRFSALFMVAFLCFNIIIDANVDATCNLMLTKTYLSNRRFIQMM